MTVTAETEGLYQHISAVTLTKAATQITSITVHSQSVVCRLLRGRVENAKGAPLRCTGFIFALRVDTRVALELNTGTFGTTRRALRLIRGALGPTREALGPSFRGTLSVSSAPPHKN